MTKTAIAKKPIELLLAFGAPLVLAILLSGHWDRVAAQSSAGRIPVWPTNLTLRNGSIG